MQSKRQSKIESVVQQIVGFIVGLFSQLLIYPILGIEVNLTQILIIGVAFAIISGVRNYIVRRLFNRFNKGDV